MSTKEPKRTGLVCPKCKTRHGIIESQQPRVIIFRCQVCDHRWFVDEPATTKH